MKRAALVILSIIGAAAIMRKRLNYFKPEEFRDWYDRMSPELLQKLDAFRAEWGAPVVVSSAHGGLGRHGGEHDESQHNVDKWGEVRAIDVFPKIETAPGVFRWMETADERQRAYQVAKSVGFTGIGLYTDTRPGNMLHVDVRRGRLSGQPATWSRVGGSYLGLGEVFV